MEYFTDMARHGHRRSAAPRRAVAASTHHAAAGLACGPVLHPHRHSVLVLLRSDRAVKMFDVVGGLAAPSPA